MRLRKRAQIPPAREAVCRGERPSGARRRPAAIAPHHNDFPTAASQSRCAERPDPDRDQNSPGKNTIQCPCPGRSDSALPHTRPRSTRAGMVLVRGRGLPQDLSGTGSTGASWNLREKMRRGP